MFQVEFEQFAKTVECMADETVLDAVQRAGLGITAICGGNGSCGCCVIRVSEGSVSLPDAIEELELGRTRLDAGFRLACQARVQGDLKVVVPPDSLASTQRSQTEGIDISTEIAPAVHCVELHMPAPSLSDLRSDAARIRDALDAPGLTFDVMALRCLPDDLRQWGFQVSAFVCEARSELIALRPVGTAALGLAVDVGTTKLAAYLVDLASGQTVAVMGIPNPQIAYGADVMTRIGHAISHEAAREQLRQSIVGAINRLASQLCDRAARATADIADAVVVGNTAMHHLFLGLPVRQLGLAPYIAAESSGMSVPARDLGLEFAPGARVYLLPNIAGFVGADHVAMLLATGLPERPGVVLGMDIGTNTEISLRTPAMHLSCSTASGPAFEGAHIRDGMVASPGAIERVVIRGDQVFIKTVDDAPPVGICGSGILDLVAQLLRAGVIDGRGRMLDHPRVRRGDNGPEFVVVPGAKNSCGEITFSRHDLGEVQLAKAAMRAGTRVLLHLAGVSESEIDEVIIAGAFGTYLDVQSGIDIGMFPPIDRQRFKQVGNAAGAGARLALLSTLERERSARIVQNVEYVELTVAAGFQSEFLKACAFPMPDGM